MRVPGDVCYVVTLVDGGGDCGSIRVNSSSFFLLHPLLLLLQLLLQTQTVIVLAGVAPVCVYSVDICVIRDLGSRENRFTIFFLLFYIFQPKNFFPTCVTSNSRDAVPTKLIARGLRLEKDTRVWLWHCKKKERNPFDKEMARAMGEEWVGFHPPERKGEKKIVKKKFYLSPLFFLFSSFRPQSQAPHTHT